MEGGGRRNGNISAPGTDRIRISPPRQHHRGRSSIYRALDKIPHLEILRAFPTHSTPDTDTMSRNYRFILYAEHPNGKRASKAFAVSAYSNSAFEPYDICADPMTAMATGGVMRRGAERIDTERMELINEISHLLANHILNAIQSQDKINGYPRTETTNPKHL